MSVGSLNLYLKLPFRDGTRRRLQMVNGKERRRQAMHSLKPTILLCRSFFVGIRNARGARDSVRIVQGTPRFRCTASEDRGGVS
jgi:hypothetical protein